MFSQCSLDVPNIAALRDHSANIPGILRVGWAPSPRHLTQVKLDVNGSKLKMVIYRSYTYIYIYIYHLSVIYLIEIFQNLQIYYLKFHAMNDDFQAILKLSHNSNTLILDKV